MPREDPHSAEDPLLGAVLGNRYKVLELVGEGGMGQVYRGQHVGLDRPVAIKVLRHEFGMDRSLIERFLREARAASRIGHENIVDIIDVGNIPEGGAYFVMEFLEGNELEDLLNREGRMPWARARGILIQIARALGAAHKVGVIHRDMKPSNVVLVHRDGNPDYVKLLDFGIAKIEDEAGLTQTGMVFGTVAYMSPEQAMAQSVDSRADIYALGCLAFELLSGQLPFDDVNPTRMLDMHIEDPAPKLREVSPHAGIPPAVEVAVLRAMAKAADDRFQTMAAFADALAAVPADYEVPGAGKRKRPPRPQVRRAPILARKRVTSAPIDVRGARVPMPPELTMLSTLYVALAASDGELDGAETELIVERVHEWRSSLARRDVGTLLRHTLADFQAMAKASPDGGLAARNKRVSEACEDLQRLLERKQLAAILADLYEIAGVDGRVPDEELRFIVKVTSLLGLTPDPRLLATAYLYLTLSHADGVVDPEEVKVVHEQLRSWAPEASEAEVKTVIRWARAEFERRPSVDEQLACAQEAANQLSLSADPDALRRILADLWRIAGADGFIADEEQRFIMDMVERFSGRS
ncbi:serine/threonine protein kinase [Plesiocystis pacifica SIR-1]|uniref:non-specific serine/threonine protein kinase n=1 Tax=Plesiocystis pacifica SIR-1 TaxID=391625 RepID=A6FY01_9BACT|nr:protein kinase [Plesiocystis pacifica]EDM81380.1 serine/threonine protein kinase [Plesiocystis pacifica SIR-1]